MMAKKGANKKVMRDLADLQKKPLKPLTAVQIKHFDEYMTFKNHGTSAKNVSITEAVDDVIAKMDYCLGISKAY